MSNEEVVRLSQEMLRDLVIGGMAEHEVEACVPIFQDYAPAMLAAIKRSDRQELARLAYSLRDTLVVKGGLTLERIEQIRAVLHRYPLQCERALFGAGAGDTALIDEMRELNSLMARRESRYWKGADADRLQHRWRELQDLGVRADGKRSIPAADVDDRMLQIESLMDNPRSEYYRGESAEALQLEYRELVDHAIEGKVV